MPSTHKPKRLPATIGKAVFLNEGGAMRNVFEIHADETGGTVHFSTHWSSADAYSQGEYWGTVQEYAQDGNRSLSRGTITRGDFIGGAFEFVVIDGDPDQVRAATYPPNLLPVQWPPCAQELAYPDGTDLGQLAQGNLRIVPRRPER